MSDEELIELQEQLAGAREEIERLQTSLADREARATTVEEQVRELRGEVEARDGEVAQLRERSDALAAQVQSAAVRYRALVLERSPELLEDLVQGETVEEVDAAVERARETVAKVQGHLESQAQSTRVPVGAPVRSAPDHSALPAHEKIRLGIEQRRG